MTFSSGINIDVSPGEGQIFPVSEYAPLAAYNRDESGDGNTLRQEELHEQPMEQSVDNPHKIDLAQTIEDMKREAGTQVHVDESDISE